MKPHIVSDFSTSTQANMYYKLNMFSVSQPLLGRLGAIPVSIIDVALDTIQPPLSAVESAVLVVFNVVGAIFRQYNYSLKDALANVEWTFMNLALASVKIALAPLKILHQFVAILVDPVNVNDINYYRATFH